MRCKNCDTEVFWKNNICPVCGSSLKSKLKISHTILIIIAIPILFGVFSVFFSDTTSVVNKEHNIQSNSSLYEGKTMEFKNVKIINDYENYYDNDRYSKETTKMVNQMFGIESGSEIFAPLNEYVIELYAKFENHNPYDVIDIKYSCIHCAESGTVIKVSKGVKYIGISANGYVYRKLNLGFKKDDVSLIKCICTGFTKE